MRFSTSKLIEDNKRIYINIRLDDECKNGHQDFAITGDIYSHPTLKSDRYHETGGCIHGEIEKYFPEFAIFIKLHLADYTGCPMYAVQNGFYHLQNGFERTKPEDFPSEFCKYYRITLDQYNFLANSENELHFAIGLIKLGIPDQWQKEANEAINILEGLTGKKFINTSTKTQFKRPTETEILAFDELYKNGYFNQENKAKRLEEKKQAKKDKIISGIIDRCNETIEKAQKNKEVNLALYEAGGELALDQTIFYDHSQEIKFNYKDYGKKLTPEEIQNIKNNLVLSFPVKFRN